MSKLSTGIALVITTLIIGGGMALAQEMGQAPGTGQVSLRTFPRNFPGRSGTKDDQVYLCSPETGAAAALKGVITDPRDLGKEMVYPRVEDPKAYVIDRVSLVLPSSNPVTAEVIRGSIATFSPTCLQANRLRTPPTAAP